MVRELDIPLMIGRFQPFHKGHLHGVKYIYKRHEELIIGIGSAFESHTLKNPFTTAERIKMIILGLSEAGISRNKYLIIPIPDTRTHRTWVSTVKTLVPDFNIIYSNDPLTRVLFEEANYKVESIPLYRREVYSGEEFRRRVIEGENWREIVQDSVADYLMKGNLLERIKELVKTDKPYKRASNDFHIE